MKCENESCFPFTLGKILVEHSELGPHGPGTSVLVFRRIRLFTSIM